MAVGLLLLVRTPVDGNFLVDVLPATLAVGLGAGIGFNPILLAAMSGVAPTEAGLASGVVNTAFMMGGALGLAVLASVAASRTESLESSGESAARGAERRLPRRLRPRRDLRRRLCGRRRAAPAARDGDRGRARSRRARRRACDRGRLEREALRPAGEVAPAGRPVPLTRRVARGTRPRPRRGRRSAADTEPAAPGMRPGRRRAPAPSGGRTPRPGRAASPARSG